MTINGTVAPVAIGCNAPINLAAANITDATADVSWDAQAGATAYEYVVDELSTDPTGAGTSTTNLTESIASLNASTTYYLHVRTDCGGGNFSDWTTISFTTTVAPCDAPINLAAANITDATADVSWDAQAGATAYEYVVDELSTDPTGAGTSTTNLTESIASLNASTTYYLHVRTDCGGGNFSDWTTISFTTTVAPCDAPTNLAAANITDATADVSWDAQTGATAYEYVVDELSTDPTGAGTSTTNLTESIASLNASTTYYLHVRTDCGGGNFSDWTTISFTTTVATCDAPINLAAANITDATADVSWDAQAGATAYEYVVDELSTDPTGAGTSTTNLTESIASLNASTTYYLHVRTDCGGGNFSDWTTISFTTTVAPCDAPINLAVANITDATADVSWDAQAGATAYEYVVDELSTDPTGAGTSTTNLTESIASLNASTTYYLHVRTDCGGGNFSDWTTISFTTTVAPCDAPINLAAANITDATADVSWDAQAGATVYEYVVDELSTDPTGAGTSTTNLTESIASLNASTTYYLHVRTDCGGGNFSDWTTISFTTTVAPCDAPINLAAANITDATADVSWDAQAGATAYEYVVDELSTDPTGAGTSTTNLTESIASLNASTTYYLHVRTDCGGGNFSDWTTISFTTTVAPCDAPINLAVANITDATADVSWDAQAGATVYEYVVDELSTDPTGAGTSTTNLTESIASLNASTTYYLHVRTDCGGGNFSDWTTISFTTTVAPCDAPTGLSVTNITHQAAELQWDAQGGSEGYEYVVDQTSAEPAGAGTSTLLNAESINGLTPQTTYYLHVRTDCGGGNFSDWTTISFTTDLNVGLGENVEQPAISIYPNPTSRMVTIEGSGNVELISMTGVVLQTITFSGSTTMNLEGYDKGMYIIRLDQGNHQHIQQIIKH